MGWRIDNEVQQMLRESAQRQLAASAGPEHFRSVRRSTRGFDAQAWLAMGELGWTGMLLPESVGGTDLGLATAATLAEELGRALAPEPFVSAAVIAAQVLADSGEAGATLAAALAAGRSSATLAWQEKRGDLDATSGQSQLADGVLNGQKCFVPWHDGAALLVATRSDDAWAIVQIDPAARGLIVDTQRMTDGTYCASLRFERVQVSADRILLSGTAAAATLERALTCGTIALSAQLAGLAEGLWALTADYLRQRVQFDQPLGDFQAIRHRMVDLHGQIELAAASWRTALSALERGTDARVSLHAAKARCGDAAMDMSRSAVQYHGAFGYTEEADVGLFLNAALRWSSWLGTAAAHRRRALAHHVRQARHDG